MPNKITKTQDDAQLLEFFKDFEKILSRKSSDINWSKAVDFQVFSEFFISDIQNIQERLKKADDQYLYYVCLHTFNILDWIKLIVAAGRLTFADAFERLFEERFGDKYILQNLYDACFEKWISQKSGQWKIGENFYNVLEGKLYYRNRFGSWFEVDRKTAFDLNPDKELIGDNNLVKELNSKYKETRYEAVLKKWEDRQYKGSLPDNFLEFNEKETSPEAYFDFTLEHIKKLLENPVSVVELERWNGDTILDLEYIIKMTVLIFEITKKIRDDDKYTIYLLRDCLMFYEMHATMDLIDSKYISADQLLIGRKLLNSPMIEAGYYIVMLDALYTAHKRYPENFDDFYGEYTRLMDIFVSLSPEFTKVIAGLADYIKEHIKKDKDKIVIFDTGFQGSIALLTKYIIDCYIKPNSSRGKIETDIKIAVGAEWSKKMFGDRYDNDYFTFLNRVQLMARSDELYHYKQGSLNSGKLSVMMGSKEWQRKASIELVVLVMIVLLEQKE